MKEETTISKHREKYPISIDEICKYSSFEQILGKKPEDYTPKERKQRWKKCIAILSNDTKEYWADTSSCQGCAHLSLQEAWCRLQELPCTVNPILTYSYGMIGMACCGAGKEELEPELFSKDDDFPF